LPKPPEFRPAGHAATRTRLSYLPPPPGGNGVPFDGSPINPRFDLMAIDRLNQDPNLQSLCFEVLFRGKLLPALARFLLKRAAGIHFDPLASLSSDGQTIRPAQLQPGREHRRSPAIFGGVGIAMGRTFLSALSTFSSRQMMEGRGTGFWDTGSQIFFIRAQNRAQEGVDSHERDEVEMDSDRSSRAPKMGERLGEGGPARGRLELGSKHRNSTGSARTRICSQDRLPLRPEGRGMHERSGY